MKKEPCRKQEGLQGAGPAGRGNKSPQPRKTFPADERVSLCGKVDDACCRPPALWHTF